MTRVLVAALVVVALHLSAVAQAQKPQTGTQRKAAKAHFQQGRAYYEAGAWDDAIREYQKAFDLVPLPDLLFNIGQACRMKGDKPKAIEAYQRYLDRVPDGPLAEEARTHIAALKLKIQVEEAEAARKQALEEAAAARKRADEESAARKRAETEAAARAKTQGGDEERLKRLAIEQAEQVRKQRLADEAAQARRVEEARVTGGRGLRLAGNLTIAAGCVFIGSMLIPAVIGSKAGGQLQSYNGSEALQSYSPWTTQLDDDVSKQRAAKLQLAVLAGVGVAVLATGIVLYAVGASRRSRAVEAAKMQFGLAPAVGPSCAALDLAGRF
jgi:tetratricopeptide (TPR) repeat protein